MALLRDPGQFWSLTSVPLIFPECTCKHMGSPGLIRGVSPSTMLCPVYEMRMLTIVGIIALLLKWESIRVLKCIL